MTRTTQRKCSDRKTEVFKAWHFEIFILSEREVYHDICHIAIGKSVKFRKDYPQTA
jgi:hypothetical protein